MGNATDNGLCREDDEDERVSSFRSARRGPALGRMMAAGATKMVFSVFPRAPVKSSASSAVVQQAGDLIVVVLKSNGGTNGALISRHSCSGRKS